MKNVIYLKIKLGNTEKIISTSIHFDVPKRFEIQNQMALKLIFLFDKVKNNFFIDYFRWERFDFSLINTKLIDFNVFVF